MDARGFKRVDQGQIYRGLEQNLDHLPTMGYMACSSILYQLRELGSKFKVPYTEPLIHVLALVGPI